MKNKIINKQIDVDNKSFLENIIFILIDFFFGYFRSGILIFLYFIFLISGTIFLDFSIPSRDIFCGFVDSINFFLFNFKSVDDYNMTSIFTQVAKFGLYLQIFILFTKYIATYFFKINFNLKSFKNDIFYRIFIISVFEIIYLIFLSFCISEIEKIIFLWIFAIMLWLMVIPAYVLGNSFIWIVEYFIRHIITRF